jgi:hypothetical protein
MVWRVRVRMQLQCRGRKGGAWGGGAGGHRARVLRLHKCVRQGGGGGGESEVLTDRTRSPPHHTQCTRTTVGVLALIVPALFLLGGKALHTVP